MTIRCVIWMSLAVFIAEYMIAMKSCYQISEAKHRHVHGENESGTK